MRNYIDVGNKIIELLPTIEEGLNHVEKQLLELRYEESVALFTDTIEGILAIENALKTMETELKENNIDLYLKDLLSCLHKVVSNYKNNRQHEIEKQITDEVRPKFEIWRGELEKVVGMVVNN